MNRLFRRRLSLLEKRDGTIPETGSFFIIYIFPRTPS